MRIPTHPKYDITKSGVVSLIPSGEVVPFKIRKGGRKFVRLKNADYNLSYHAVDRLLLRTFKPLPAESDEEWMSVKYSDCDIDNVRIDNLDWSDEQYIAPDWESFDPNDRRSIPVPGYSDLEIIISHNLEFYNRVTDHVYSPSIGTHGYLEINIPDHGAVTIHRLLAITLLDHPVDVDHLVVNHKDSDKLNNEIGNIEWVTFSVNNQHAYDEGGRVHLNRRVETKDKTTGTVVIHNSLKSAARFLGTNPGMIHEALGRKCNRGIGYKGFLLKYEKDQSTWDEISGDTVKNLKPYTVAVKNMYTGEVVIYESLMKTIAGENINAKTVYRLLLSNPPVPWRGKCFQSVPDEGELTWPSYPKEVLKAFDRERNHGKPFRVTDKNGMVEYFSNLTEWCEADRMNRCDQATLSRSIKQHGKWRDWVFEFIDLNDYV